MGRGSKEALEAANFYATDLREEMELLNVNATSKAEIRASHMAWLNSVRVLESLIKEASIQ